MAYELFGKGASEREGLPACVWAHVFAIIHAKQTSGYVPSPTEFQYKGDRFTVSVNPQGDMMEVLCMEQGNAFTAANSSVVRLTTKAGEMENAIRASRHFGDETAVLEAKLLEVQDLAVAAIERLKRFRKPWSVSIPIADMMADGYTVSISDALEDKCPPTSLKATTEIESNGTTALTDVPEKLSPPVATTEKSSPPSKSASPAKKQPRKGTGSAKKQTTRGKPS